MAEICSCTSGIVNFGQPNCIPSFGRDSRLIFVNYSDDTGAVNSIKSTDTLDQTFFDGKFNGAEDIRWYLTDTINQVQGTRDDNVVQDIDGIPFNVKQGNRMYDGTFFGSIAAPQFEKSLQSMACRRMGFFIITVAGEIIGMSNSITGDLDPIKVQRSTLQTKYTYPSATELQSMNLKFMIEENEKDSDLSSIGSDNITVDMLTQSAMSTVSFGAAGTITTTTFITQMDFLYGEAFDKIAFEGAVIGDFVLTEVSPTPGAIVITTVVESSTVPGLYTVTFPLATSADVLSLAYSKTTGVGFEALTPLSITIP